MDKNFLFEVHANSLKHLKEKIIKRFGDEGYYQYFIKFIISNIPISYIFSLYEGDVYEKDVIKYNVKTGKNDTERIYKLYKHIINKLFKDIKEIEDKSFVFLGFNESGKTHTAIHILSYAIDNGMTGYYISSKDYINLHNFCSYSKEVTDNDRHLLDFIYSCDVLVVDELGKEPQTDPSLIALEVLIKQRQANLVSTIFVTNYGVDKSKTETPNEIKANYKESIWSALMKNYIFLQFASAGKFRLKTRTV